MKITTSLEKFEKEWKSTGHMIEESPATFVQTYEHPRFEGRFLQKRVVSPFGVVIELESTEK